MKESLKETVMLGATAARLHHVYDYTKRVKEGRSIKGLTAAIIGIDIGDGIIARRLGVEGPARRAADSMVDSAIIAAGLVSTYRDHPRSRKFTTALAAREVFVGAGWAIDLATSRRVKKGDDFHKLPSLSIAAFCLAANHYSDRAVKIAGVTAVAINYALAYDYFKGWTEPSRNRVMDNGVEEVPGFYDARVAVKRFAQGRTLLTAAADAPPELTPVTGEPVIDVSFEEVS